MRRNRRLHPVPGGLLPAEPRRLRLVLHRYAAVHQMRQPGQDVPGVSGAGGIRQLLLHGGWWQRWCTADGVSCCPLLGDSTPPPCKALSLTRGVPCSPLRCPCIAAGVQTATVSRAAPACPARPRGAPAAPRRMIAARSVRTPSSSVAAAASRQAGAAGGRGGAAAACLLARCAATLTFRPPLPPRAEARGLPIRISRRRLPCVWYWPPL